MLMTDMNESERTTVRELNQFWIPEGADLVELLEHGVDNIALLRMSDGSVQLKILGDPDSSDPVQMLDDRISKYKRAIDETERFRGIARAALGLQKDEDQPWACPSCGIHFYDSQPVCPACGAEH